LNKRPERWRERESRGRKDRAMNSRRHEDRIKKSFQGTVTRRPRKTVIHIAIQEGKSGAVYRQTRGDRVVRGRGGKREREWRSLDCGDKRESRPSTFRGKKKGVALRSVGTRRRGRGELKGTGSLTNLECFKFWES